MRLKFLRREQFENQGRNKGPVFDVGEIYDLVDALGQRYLDSGAAEQLESDKIVTENTFKHVTRVQPEPEPELVPPVVSPPASPPVKAPAPAANAKQKPAPAAKAKPESDQASAPKAVTPAKAAATKATKPDSK
jgi:hypothetical protein